jgi:hypothetical protein
MGSEQLTGIFLIIFTNPPLTLIFLVGAVWLSIQWQREAKYLNEHSWLCTSSSPTEKRRIAKKFSKFWPVALFIVGIVLYLIKVFFIKHQLH